MKKLNKKGFTLVELLAVIAILAILIVIMVPGVMSLFNKGKKNTFLTEAQSVYKVAEETYLLEVPTSAKTFCNIIDTKHASDSTSIGSGNAEKLSLGGIDTMVSYKVEINANGDVTSFVVTDGTYSISLPDTPGSTVKISDIKVESLKEGDQVDKITCPES